MSPFPPRRPEEGGPWEPAFPPVMIFERDELVEQAGGAAGLSKLEWATIKILAVNCANMALTSNFDNDFHVIQRVVEVAGLALRLAAGAGDQELATAMKAAQADEPSAGRPSPAEPVTGLGEPSVGMALDMLHYLTETHQLDTFRRWYHARVELEGVDLHEMDKIQRGDYDPPAGKGG